MKIDILRHSDVSLADQVERQIRSAIGAGRWTAGTRLPSIRLLAGDLGVSRNTVIEAYERLIAQGVARSRPGSGYFVEDSRARGHTPGLANPTDAGDVTDELWHLFSDKSDSVKLGCGWLDESWREDEGMAYAIRQIVRCDRASLFDYGSPLGASGLRAALSRRLGTLNIAAPAQQILLTSSASHALDLIIRLTLRPGDTVLVENPGYYNLFGLLKLQGIHMIGVPRTVNGPDIEVLERLLSLHKPKLFFVNSVFQNPTGTSISTATAHRVLQLAEKHDFRVIEDDIYADFESASAVRMSALDQLRRVIYVGSFSKSLSCSLRVGFIAAAPQHIKALVDVKMLTSITSSRFGEQVLTAMIESGSYRKLVDRLRRRLEARLAQTCQMMSGVGWQLFDRPPGGMFVWARWPGICDGTELVKNAAARGVKLSNGSAFTPDALVSPWLRINVTYAEDPRAKAFLEAPV
ncbi:PLP-dependent aminotransferase family protein [Roseateles sp. DB2]|uniref:aminotransferase-like domain-containing protein n=1 Tax=Roseateles sp. DB2 TaxID=3453717 RepID=UPI003EE98BEF